MGANEKPRGGRSSPSYRVTTSGLIYLLAAIRKYGNRLELDGELTKRSIKIYTLTEKFPSAFPNIFGLWTRFEKQKVHDLAEKRLLRIAALILGDLEVPSSRYRKNSESEDIPEPTHTIEGHQIEAMFFDLSTPFLFDNAEMKRWRQSLVADEELRKPFLARLSRKKTYHYNMIKKIDAYIKDISGVQTLDDSTAAKLHSDAMNSVSDDFLF